MTQFTSEVAVCYYGSDGDRTKALYDRLKAMGPAGHVAVNLLRACKNSERAKAYKSRRSVGAAYGTKEWAIGELIGTLMAHADSLGIAWGWGRDEKTVNFENVLYIEVPDSGQISFHIGYRGAGPDHVNPWDGVRGVAAARVIRYANAILGIEQPEDATNEPQRDRPETAPADAAGSEQARASEQPQDEQKGFGF